MKKKLLFVAVLLSAAILSKAQTTYYWVGGNGVSNALTAKDWSADNWNTLPDASGTARTVSSGTDILIFDGNAPQLKTTKNIFIKNVPRDSCGQLQITNGAVVTVLSVATPNIALTGYTTAGSKSFVLNTSSGALSSGLAVTGASLAASTNIASYATGVALNTNVITVNGSTIVTLTATNPNIASGYAITSAANLPAGTSIASVNQAIIVTDTTGNIDSATTSITIANANPAIEANMGITGTGIPANTYVVAVSGTTIIISAPANRPIALGTFTFTKQDVTLTAAAIADGLATATIAGTTAQLSQPALASVAIGTPANFTLNPETTPGSFTTTATYGGCVVPITGTGTAFTSYFKPGDYFMSGTTANQAVMTQVLNVVDDNNLVVSNELAQTPGNYLRATALYIKGNPGLIIDTATTLAFGSTNNTFGAVNGFVLSLSSGATGLVKGTLSFNSRAIGARLFATDPGSLVFASTSKLIYNVINRTGVYLVGSPRGYGSTIDSTFGFNKAKPSVVLQYGSNFIQYTSSNTPFGFTVNAANPLSFTPAVEFQHGSNYSIFTDGNRTFVPWFYSCQISNSGAVNPGSAATFGNLIWSNSSYPRTNGTTRPFILAAANIDTLYFNSTAANAATNASSFTTPLYISGAIVNNNAQPFNFGTVIFKGSNPITVGKALGTGAVPTFVGVGVADGSSVTLDSTISVTKTVNNFGKLNLKTFNIDGAVAGAATAVFNATGSFNATYLKRGDTINYCTTTAHSNAIVINGISIIPVGATVTSNNRPNIFPVGTTVLAYGGSGKYTLSNVADSSYSADTSNALSLTFTKGFSTLVTASPSGLNAGLTNFVAVNSVLGASYQFDAPTTTPFHDLTPATVSIGGLAISGATTLNKHIVYANGVVSLPASGNLTINADDSLVLSKGAGAITGGSAAAFIDTKVNTATGTKAALGITNLKGTQSLPVGTNNNYLPIKLVTSKASAFYVAAFNGATVDGTPNGAVSPLKPTSVNAIYAINRTAPVDATDSFQVDLGYTNNLKGATFATYTNTIGISRYDSTTWLTAVGGGTNTTNYARAKFTTGGAFLVTFNANPEVLSVKFAGISASIDGLSGVKVAWSALNEVNLDKYVVESSANGNNFSAIGSVVASGSKTYKLNDFVPLTGVRYYRVKAIDKGTGAATYSAVVYVNAASKVASVNVYPNPVTSGQVNIQYTNLPAGKVTVLLLNSLGQQIATQIVQSNGGSFAQKFDVPTSAKGGVYQLIVKDAVNTFNKAVLIIK